MAKEFSKICTTCGCSFIGTGPAARYCPEHQEQNRLRVMKQQRERVARDRAASGQIAKPGVGKGGNPYYKEQHPSYKHGFYVAQRQSAEVKKRVRYCERCHTDLLLATHYFWTVHHKDHNHSNHSEDNLELLCKRCHQIEHKCHLAFTKGATTIPKGSRLKRAEAPDTLQGDDIVSPTQ